MSEYEYQIREDLAQHVTYAWMTWRYQKPLTEVAFLNAVLAFRAKTGMSVKKAHGSEWAILDYIALCPPENRRFGKEAEAWATSQLAMVAPGASVSIEVDFNLPPGQFVFHASRPKTAAVQGPFGANWVPPVAAPSAGLMKPKGGQCSSCGALVSFVTGTTQCAECAKTEELIAVLEASISENDLKALEEAAAKCSAKPNCGKPDWRCTRCHKDNCPSAEKCWNCQGAQ